MKRRIVTITVAVLAFVLIFDLLFGKLGILASFVYYEKIKLPVTQFQDFADYRDDFTGVCDYLRTYYEQSGEAGKIVVDFFGGKIQNHDELIADNINDQLTQQVTTVENRGFSVAWVESKWIIFWEDETKQYGLLFSESPMRAISATRKWYPSMRYKKIDRYWYEIGQLGAR